jgi:hypothetical protein
MLEDVLGSRKDKLLRRGCIPDGLLASGLLNVRGMFAWGICRPTRQLAGYAHDVSGSV